MQCLVISLDAQLSAVDSLIDSMMLVEEDENGEQKDLLKVHHIPNPAFQRHFQVLRYRSPITFVLGLYVDCKVFKEEILFCNISRFLAFEAKENISFVSLKFHQIVAVCIHPDTHVPFPTFLSVPASSGSKPQHPTSPYGAMAEGCS